MAWLKDSHGDIIVFGPLSIMSTYSLVADTLSMIKLMVSIIMMCVCVEDVTINYGLKKNFMIKV